MDTKDGNVWVQLALNIILVVYRWLESVVLAFIPSKFYSKDIKGQIILITGGGSGIGQLMAIRFARLGATVVIWDVNQQGMDETCRLVRQDGGQARQYVCDVSDRVTVYAVAKKVKEEVGKVDILVNNAGIVNGKKFLDLQDDQIVKVHSVNTMANFWTCKAFLPDMIQADHGHLVFVSSMAGITGSSHLTDYCASKYAVVGFEESLRLELRSTGVKGVRSTCVCPYFTNTGLFHGVSTAILPLLEPPYVADCVVNGVLTNQEFVLVPWAMLGLFILKMMIPVSAQYALYDAVGGGTFMDKFTGRTGVKVTATSDRKILNADQQVNGVKQRVQ